MKVLQTSFDLCTALSGPTPETVSGLPQGRFQLVLANAEHSSQFDFYLHGLYTNRYVEKSPK